MLGAIIGDLAAWTYEHDKDAFYAELIHPEAKLSEIGLAVLSMYDLIKNEHPDIEWSEMISHFSRSFPSCSNAYADLSYSWTRFFEHGRTIPITFKRVMNVATDIVSGWFDDPVNTAKSWGIRFKGYKEEAYLTQVAGIIYRLRHGATKKEAIKDTMFIEDWNSWHQEKIGPLSYGCYAWNCFINSFDFTSALHNAMRCPLGDKHILGALTGAIAEAMYGCNYLLLKQKYNKNELPWTPIQLPAIIMEQYGERINEISQFKESNRIFFPKNNALTNVEFHTWTEVKNPWYNTVISPHDKAIIIKAFYTDWEQRYGLYLENGWIYCYRSGYLICRFIFAEQGDGTYRIRHLQKNESTDDYVTALTCAGWPLFQQNNISEFSLKDVDMDDK